MTVALPTFARRAAGPLAAGGVGLVGLAWHLWATLDAAALPPALASLPASAVVALSLLNPLVLLVLASLAGAALAHRTSLRSALAGTAPWPRAAVLGQAVLLGLALGLGIGAADVAWSAAAGGWTPAAGAPARTLRQLVLGLTYGGLAEEVLMRWGLLATLAWALHRTLARRRAQVPAWVMVAAVVLAALLFAAGHLPAVAASGALTPMLAARTLLLNTLAGVAYGWLFWRRGLEPAMAAHAATHAGFFLLAWTLG